MANTSGYGFTSKDKLEEFQKKHPKLASRGYSQNKNPNAIRSESGRQTYIGRETKGKAGWFDEDEKILMRFSMENWTDMNFINKVVDEVNGAINTLKFYNKEVLEYGLGILKEALIEYTPYDTGYLASRWQVEIVNNGFDVNNDCDYCNAQNYGKYGEVNGKTRNGKTMYGWYPGYFMYERAMNKTIIKMRERHRALMDKLRREVSNG